MRSFRNVLIGLSLILLLLGLCFYSSAVIYIILVWGASYVDFHAIDPSIKNFPYRLWPSVFDYVHHWWINRVNYPIAVQLKLLISLLAPFLILGITLWNLKKSILAWRPLRKKNPYMEMQNGLMKSRLERWA